MSDNSWSVTTSQLLARFRKTQPKNTEIKSATTEDESLTFGTLPNEVQLYILSFLNPKDLARSSSVSRSWNGLSSQNVLWQSLFERDKYEWKSLVSDDRHSKGSISNTLINESKELIKKYAPMSLLDYFQNKNDKAGAESDDHSSNIVWKEIYLQQFLQNSNRELKSETSGLAKLSNIFSKKIHTIPMFGEGLDSSAKQLLYEMIWKNESRFKVTGMHPGVEGVGSGIGFVINNLNLNLCAMYKYEDRGIFDKVRPLWKEFFKSASAFVFVIDNTYSLQEAKDELYMFMSDDFTLHQPLLILLVEDTHNKSPMEVSEHFELNEKMKSRAWNVRRINTKTLEGVYEGFYWLTTKITQ